MNGFEAQKVKGKVVEEIVKRHLIGRGHTVEDVSEIKEYQKKDIDFLVANGTTKQLISMEVKRDDNIFRTGNFFFEIGFEKENYYSMGWMGKCKADYISFYDTRRNKGYILDFIKTKSGED